MNEYFGIGKVIRKENFKFVLNKNHKSRIAMTIKLIDANEVQIVAYDEKADCCYRKLKKNDFIYLNGRLNNGYEVELDNISYI